MYRERDIESPRKSSLENLDFLMLSLVSGGSRVVRWTQEVLLSIEGFGQIKALWKSLPSGAPDGGYKKV